MLILIRSEFFAAKDIPVIFIVIAFSSFILVSMWSSKFLIYYSSPIFYEKMFTGRAFIDPLFHGAVANMIKNYDVPSTGLNDTVYLPYHYLSHWVFAQFSKLLDINTLNFYQIGYPVIFVSIFFKFFFLTVKKLCNNTKSFINSYLFWFLLFVFFAGLFPKFINERFFVSNFIFVSESYNLSIILSLIVFLMLAFFKGDSTGMRIWNLKNVFFIVLLPVLIFLMGLAKSSTMVIFVIALLYIFIRYGYYKKPVYILSSVLIIISILLSLRITTLTANSSGEFQLFHFFEVVIQGRNTDLTWPVTLIIFISVYFFWSILFIIMEIIDLKRTGMGSLVNDFRNRKTIRIEIILLIGLAGIIPGIILRIHGGSANYFSDLQKWISIILILSTAASWDFDFIKIKNIKKKSIKVLLILLIVILAASIIFNFVMEYGSFYDDYSQNKEEYDGIVKQSTPDDITKYRAGLIKTLQEIDTMTIQEKSKSLIYIPVSNNEFWELKILSKSLSVPLLVPAVSGVAMIYGLPDEGLIYTRSFGYRVYKTTSKKAMDKEVDELLLEVKQKGYENLIMLDYTGGEFYFDIINDLNIEDYVDNIYGILIRSYEYSHGKRIDYEKLYSIVNNVKKDNSVIFKIISDTVLDENSLINSKYNREFVESLYRILLNREPDKPGMEHWLSEIEKGRSRKDILNSFLESHEFIRFVNTDN